MACKFCNDDQATNICDACLNLVTAVRKCKSHSIMAILKEIVPDDRAAHVAAFDSGMKAMCDSLPKLTYAYHSRLMEEGFATQQADLLTLNMHDNTVKRIVGGAA